MKPYFSIPFIHVENYEHDKQLINDFDLKFLKKHNILPIDREPGLISVAIPDVNDAFKVYSHSLLKFKEILEQKFNARVLFFMADKMKIKELLEKFEVL